MDVLTSFLAARSNESSDYQSFLSTNLSGEGPNFRKAMSHLDSSGTILHRDDFDKHVSCPDSPLAFPIQSNAAEPTMLKSLGVPKMTDGDVQQPAKLPLGDVNENPSSCQTPSLSPDARLSPSYQSIPDSPLSIRDFIGAWESDSQSQAARYDTSSRTTPLDGNDGDEPNLTNPRVPQRLSPGFQSYNLPETEQSSTTTLRKPQQEAFAPLRDISASTDVQRSVNAWNDGSDHGHLTTLEELIDDLGYLGHMIT
ncbi:MAG: hypothetical protein Q9220_004338 [cf. Caloplaca sp. 1 TL-2023]